MDYDDNGDDPRIANFLAAILSKSSLKPMPHQEHALKAARDAMSPKKRICVQIATGGGKTLVANRLALEEFAADGVVYFVAPAWVLLQQAAGGVLSASPTRFPATRDEIAERLFRLGGQPADLPLRGLGNRKGPMIVYTTIHTLFSQIEKGRNWNPPSLLIVDEAHFAEVSAIGRAIYGWAKAYGAAVVQFTATPKKQGLGKVVNVGASFPELVACGVLASVVPHDLRPRVAWNVGKSVAGDISEQSQRELAENDRYRDHVVATIARGGWGKGILFACTIPHANRLDEAFYPTGVQVHTIHSDMGPDEVKTQLDLFSKANWNQNVVLINVSMATLGLDVPDVRTVFLARPTFSESLFMQMVGRGSRRHDPSGKTSFHLVDFTPNVETFGEQLVTASQYFGEHTPSTSSRGERPQPSAKSYSYSSVGKLVWIPTGARPEIAGLCYRQQQSFGIEFEITSSSGEIPLPNTRRWRDVADRILQAARDAVGTGSVASKPITTYEGIEGEKNSGVWNVEWDSTVGWELTTPILRDQQGFEAVIDVLARVRAIVEAPNSGLSVERAGTSAHVHLGWAKATVAHTRNLVRLARLFEPGLATLLAPSRIAYFDSDRGKYDLKRSNPYSVPLCARFGEWELARAHTLDDLANSMRQLDGELDERSLRYSSLNLYGYLRHGKTVEVRSHNGTLDAAKILLWVSLWQQIVWAAEHAARIPTTEDRDVSIPDGDVIELARTWLPREEVVGVVQTQIITRLEQRRREVAQRYLEQPSLRSWHKYMRRWT